MTPDTLAATLSSDPRVAWVPVTLMILIGVSFGVGNLVLSTLIGPGRDGPGKSVPYESGMTPVGDTRRRFNVRFYIVAMIYLVFDVGIVFLFPWTTIFAPVVKYDPSLSNTLLLQMVVFIAILFVAYVYAWRKGVFKWD